MYLTLLQRHHHLKVQMVQCNPLVGIEIEALSGIGQKICSISLMTSAWQWAHQPMLIANTPSAFLSPLSSFLFPVSLCLHIEDPLLAPCIYPLLTRELMTCCVETPSTCALWRQDIL